LSRGLGIFEKYIRNEGQSRHYKRRREKRKKTGGTRSFCGGGRKSKISNGVLKCSFNEAGREKPGSEKRKGRSRQSERSREGEGKGEIQTRKKNVNVSAKGGME